MARKKEKTENTANAYVKLLRETFEEGTTRAVVNNAKELTNVLCALKQLGVPHKVGDYPVHKADGIVYDTIVTICDKEAFEKSISSALSNESEEDAKPAEEQAENA